MWRTIREIIEHHELLTALVVRDLRVKYKQAALGVAWVFFAPVLAITGGVLIRLVISVVGNTPLLVADIAAVMVKTVPWLLFAGIITQGANALLANINLVTKIYFPREVMPLSSVLSQLVDFGIKLTGLVVLLTLLYIFTSQQQPPVVIGWSLLWVIPIMATLVMLSVGLCMLLAAANLFFRDVKYIVQVAAQFGLFFSLVYYTHEELGSIGVYFLLNPVAVLLEGLRYAVVEGAMDPAFLPWMIYPPIVAVISFIAGFVVFDRAEHLFAEYA